MKTITIIKLIVITLIFNACSFNKSINKDLITGAVSKGDGLVCNDISIQINGKVDNKNTFTFGENINFVFNDIKGFKQENGKVYPEMSMIIIKKENQMVFSNLNLLNLTKGTALFPLKLQANLMANLPYKNNEKYEIQLTIWDTKGEGKFTYTMPFTVKENPLLKIKSTAIKYKSIFIWNENKNQMVIDNKLDSKDKYALVLEGVKGLKIEDGIVFPELSLMLTDAKENIIIANKNLYSNLPNGLGATKLAEGQIPIVLTFTGDEFFNPYTLHIKLKDTKSENVLNVTTELEIK